MLVPNNNTRARCTGDDESAPKTKDSKYLLQRRVSSRISRLVITSQDGAVEGTAITLWPDVGFRFWIAGHGRVADAITGCHGPSKAGASACIAGGR